MKPRCYNREPFKDTYRTSTGQVVMNRLSRDCGSWKAPEGAKPYPELAGWDCSGCKWNPNTAQLGGMLEALSDTGALSKAIPLKMVPRFVEVRNESAKS